MRLKNKSLSVFLKKPEAGKVKTRLAKDIGNEAAVQAYIHLYQLVIDKVTCSDWDTVLFIANSVDGFESYSHVKEIQAEGDLGLKMCDAISRMLQSYDACLIIGSDCPYIDKDLIKEAFDALEQNDLVLGPSTDGGYYLIGAKAAYPSLFADISWSTELVLSQTMEQANLIGLDVSLLKELTDVDTVVEWEAYLQGQ